MSLDMLKKERALLNVQRMAGKPKLRSYNLVEHSFFVTSMFIELCRREDIEVHMEDVKKVMNHDLVETLTGDLLYPAKNLNEETSKAWEYIEDSIVKENPEFIPYTDKKIRKGFSEKKWMLFKAADLLDLWIFCKEEQVLGNNAKEIQEIINNCERYLYNMNIDSVNDFINEFV